MNVWDIGVDAYDTLKITIIFLKELSCFKKLDRNILLKINLQSDKFEGLFFLFFLKENERKKAERVKSDDNMLEIQIKGNKWYIFMIIILRKQ